jgi:hypothetical protein
MIRFLKLSAARLLSFAFSTSFSHTQTSAIVPLTSLIQENKKVGEGINESTHGGQGDDRKIEKQKGKT